MGRCELQSSADAAVSTIVWKVGMESFSEWAYRVRREWEGLADVEIPPAPAQCASAP